MSLINTFLNDARHMGINPTNPIDEAGLGHVLTIADQMNLVTYKPGMNRAWYPPIALWCQQHRHGHMFTLQEMLTAVVILGANDHTDRFPTPAKFARAISDYYRANVKKALGTRREPVLPAGLEGASLETELAYKSAWYAKARLTGDGERADRETRAAFNLPEIDPPTIRRFDPAQIAGMYAPQETSQ